MIHHITYCDDRMTKAAELCQDSAIKHGCYSSYRYSLDILDEKWKQVNSWWGAWLAKSECVVAPKQWFGPAASHLETKDIYPESWIII